MSTFTTVIAEFAAAFETKTRKGGERFYRIKAKAPKWLQGSDVMREIHTAVDDRLPDDWVYEQAAAVAEALAERDIHDADDAREASHEISDSLVDVYNADRSKWLAMHLNNAALVDEAVSELGGSDADTFHRIGLGQFLAISRIADAVISACEAEADGRE